MKKISFILLTLTLSLFASCKGDANDISDAAVYIDINLLNYTTFANGIGNHLDCPGDLHNNDKIGSFGRAGIVLYHSYDGLADYRAFDKCCRNVACQNKSIPNKVTINKPIGRATCETCNSEYDLNTGLVTIGPAQKPLWQYKVTVSGNRMYVSNPNR